MMRVLGWMGLGVVGLLAPAPQGPERKVAPAPIRTDERGWPVPEHKPSARPGRGLQPLRSEPLWNRSPASQPSTSAEPSTPAGEAVRRLLDTQRNEASTRPTTPVPTSSSTAANERSGSDSVAGAPNALGSPLRPVWEVIGQPFDFLQLGGAQARVRLHVYGPSGDVLATREVTHEAALGKQRDRLVSADGRVIRGRDGATAFETIDGVVWHQRAAAAAAELELLGTLLRAPWSFSEGKRFVVYPRASIRVDGRELAMIRVAHRPSTESVGPPTASTMAGPEYRLLCDPTSMRPVELRYRLRADSVERRVLLRDWRPVQGGIRLPVRRLLVDDAGRPTLEIEIVRMQMGVRLDPDAFRAAPGR